MFSHSQLCYSETYLQFFFSCLSNNRLLWKDFHNARSSNSTCLISLIYFLPWQNSTVREKKSQGNHVCDYVCENIELYLTVSTDKQSCSQMWGQLTELCSVSCLPARLHDLTGIKHLKCITLIVITAPSTDFKYKLNGTTQEIKLALKLIS